MAVRYYDVRLTVTRHGTAMERTVPPLRGEFNGCRFAPRCDVVMDVCHDRVPSWHLRGDHGALCHLYSNTDARAPAPAQPVQQLLAELSSDEAAASDVALLDTRGDT